jgi:hypothetical protein
MRSRMRCKMIGERLMNTRPLDIGQRDYGIFEVSSSLLPTLVATYTGLYPCTHEETLWRIDASNASHISAEHSRSYHNFIYPCSLSTPVPTPPFLTECRCYTLMTTTMSNNYPLAALPPASLLTRHSARHSSSLVVISLSLVSCGMAFLSLPFCILLT